MQNLQAIDIAVNMVASVAVGPVTAVTSVVAVVVLAVVAVVVLAVGAAALRSASVVAGIVSAPVEHPAGEVKSQHLVRSLPPAVIHCGVTGPAVGPMAFHNFQNILAKCLDLNKVLVGQWHL